MKNQEALRIENALSDLVKHYLEPGNGELQAFKDRKNINDFRSCGKIDQELVETDEGEVLEPHRFSSKSSNKKNITK